MSHSHLTPEQCWIWHIVKHPSVPQIISPHHTRIPRHHTSVHDYCIQAYGESAFTYIPPTYLIPEQYWLWRNALLDTGSPPDSKWVLKANVHRGKGVQVVSQTEALSNVRAWCNVNVTCMLHGVSCEIVWPLDSYTLQ